MPVRPMLLHRMALVSFRLFCKNLGNLHEFFGQMVYRAPWPKIARTPMGVPEFCNHVEREITKIKKPSKSIVADAISEKEKCFIKKY